MDGSARNPVDPELVGDSDRVGIEEFEREGRKMMTFAKLAVAGVAGFFVLKLLAALLVPILGLAAGIVALGLKLILVLAIGWLVLSIFRRRSRETA